MTTNTITMQGAGGKQYSSSISEDRWRMEKQVNPILLEEIKKKIKELAALREIGKEISASLDLNQVLNTIMECALELLNAKKGCIILIDPAAKELKVAVIRGLSEEESRKLTAQTIDDISRPQVMRSFLCTPLKIKNTIIGVININNGNKGTGFTKRHLEILNELADQAAIAIDNARAHKELQEVALETIKSLALTIDQRDHYTSRHSENVARYATAIAREMNLPEEEIKKIGQAAHLHDIGKIGIRDYILSKPGKLSPEEWEEIKTHCSKGADILKPLEFLNGIIDFVRQHHERPDGKGYPGGLKGEDITMGARIMAVADSFDAMTSDRPYRPAMSPQKAADEIKSLSGIMYDPQVVKAFVLAIEKKAI